MSSLQELAAEYGVDGFEYGYSELANEHAMDWINGDLHGFLDEAVDYPNLPGTRSRGATCSSRTWDTQRSL